MPIPFELQQSAREIQQQARQTANDAREAAREAVRLARENEVLRSRARDAVTDGAQGTPGIVLVQPPVPPLPPAAPGAPQGPATIVIPSDAGEDIHINVNGSGIEFRQGDAVTTIPIHEVVPNGVVDIVQAVGATLVFIIVGWPLAKAFARWLDRRGSAVRLSSAVEARLEAMERNIDTVAVELERVSEGQRFTAKLIEQRPLEHAQRSDR